MHDRNAIRRTPDPDAQPGLKLRLEDRFGMLDPIQLLVFRSFGTPDMLHIRGRVLERKNVEAQSEESSVSQNVRNAFRRFDSDEIPGAVVEARFAGGSWKTKTDGEGYFVIDIDPPKPLEPGWHTVELAIVDSIGEPADDAVEEDVLVPFPDAEFAVVSDLDDTVIETHSTDLRREIAIIFGKGAHTRVVLPGVASFYRALSKGPDDRRRNPIFYVSLSGWNLYDLFEEFMRVQDLPKGPLFLSDFRILESKSKSLGHDEHKFESIDLLIRTYPDLPFILIGDSGMHDAETYRKIARAHPGRVRAIYIRDITPNREDDDEILRIAEELESEGVQMALVPDALEAAEHALANGLIAPAHLETVRDEVRPRAEPQS